MPMQKSWFWEDLAADLMDSEYLRAYAISAIKIHTIDLVRNLWICRLLTKS